MITYNDLYELLRKEKYNESLQTLPAGFISDISSFLAEQKEESSHNDGGILGNAGRSNKKFENAVSLFNELVLRRKKKILNLVFVATETGIMKRDYENMLPSEKTAFDSMTKVFEEFDKKVSEEINGESEKAKPENSMILFNQETEQFVDSSGTFLGPFKAGDLANLDSSVCDLLVTSGKASYVDEK